MSRVTIATVNAALKQAGHPHRLVRSNPVGYFYFTGPGTELWRGTSVYVQSAAQLSVASWLAEYQRLKAETR